MASTTPEKKEEVPAEESPPSATDLFSSAKLVAGAAQDCFQGGADKVDKSKTADAAGDLLGAASTYGKLEEKGYGGYVEKAETFLHQYGSAPAPAPVPAPAPAPAPPAGGEAKPEEGGAGAGLMKMATSFLGGK